MVVNIDYANHASSDSGLGNNYVNHLLNCAKIHLSRIEDGKNVDESFMRWRKKTK